LGYDSGVEVLRAVTGALMGIVVGSPFGCGGRSSHEVPGVAGSPTTEDSCECPSVAPSLGEACSCPGLECMRARQWCWSGRMICGTDGSWASLTDLNAVCPSEPPAVGTYRLCDGEGTCTYPVDTGCGLAEVVSTCTCLDASYLLTTRAADVPSLCSCSAIESAVVCALYPTECTWLEASARCEPKAP
jgi:hypothetical protein